MQYVISYAQIIGQVVRSRREMQGIPLLTMAESVNLSTASGWSRVETGDTTMTLAQLRKAARALGIEPSLFIQQADTIALQLEEAGIIVYDERPKNMGKRLLSGTAILGALVGMSMVRVPKKTDQNDRPVGREVP